MRVHAVVLILLGFASIAAADERHFQSPSGNIRCVLTDADGQVARCDLGVDHQSYMNPPASCDGDWGMSFGLDRTGGGVLNCVTDAIAGPANPVILPYGATAVFADVSCRSEMTGVTCINTAGGGFAVRRSEQRIF